jgi:hypothetical protein
MQDKLKVTAETAKSDAGGIGKVINQIIENTPYIRTGIDEGMFDDMQSPYHYNRLAKLAEKHDKAVFLAAAADLWDMAQEIARKK